MFESFLSCRNCGEWERLTGSYFCSEDCQMQHQSKESEAERKYHGLQHIERELEAFDFSRVFIKNKHKLRNRKQNKNLDLERGFSETKIHLKNLPYSMEDKDLASLFEGFKVREAHIVFKRGKSLGFGFVDFFDSEEQERALKMDGIQVGGRTISIQVAHKEKNRREERVFLNIGMSVERETECQVCMEEYASSELVKWCHSEKCKDCFERSIVSACNDSSSFPPSCNTCHKQLCPEDVHSMALRNEISQETFSLFDSTFTKMMLKMDTIRCVGCGEEVLVVDSEEHSFLVCSHCECKICTDCNKQWHPNLSCEESELALAGVKYCPHCRVKVLKDEKGCFHTQCYMCKTHFCYTCFLKFRTAPEVYLHMKQMGHDPN